MEQSDGYNGRALQDGPRVEIALFASDCLCQRWQYFAPHALQAHGTCQDLQTGPEGWNYGLFPNYCNVLWSCNRAPVSNFRRSEYAVETFEAPVPISNGYGDNMGFSEMTSEMQKKVLDLFARRKKRRLQIAWNEERGGIRTIKENQ